jgi:hypothetical protein
MGSAGRVNLSIGFDWFRFRPPERTGDLQIADSGARRAAIPQSGDLRIAGPFRRARRIEVRDVNHPKGASKEFEKTSCALRKTS